MAKTAAKNLEVDETNLAQVEVTPTILPTRSNLDHKFILDSKQLRFLKIKRQIWNGDLQSKFNGPPLKSAVPVGNWRFHWGGLQGNQIAIEK